MRRRIRRRERYLCSLRCDLETCDFLRARPQSTPWTRACAQKVKRDTKFLFYLFSLYSRAFFFFAFFHPVFSVPRKHKK